MVQIALPAGTAIVITRRKEAGVPLSFPPETEAADPPETAMTLADCRFEFRPAGPPRFFPPIPSSSMLSPLRVRLCPPTKSSPPKTWGDPDPCLQRDAEVFSWNGNSFGEFLFEFPPVEGKLRECHPCAKPPPLAPTHVWCRPPCPPACASFFCDATVEFHQFFVSHFQTGSMPRPPPRPSRRPPVR